MHLYTAFGSNLDPAQMRRRCPSARLVGTTLLHGRRLVFAGRSASWGGGVATLRRAPGDVTPAVVYSLTHADLVALDRCEGAPTGTAACRCAWCSPGAR